MTPQKILPVVKANYQFKHDAYFKQANVSGNDWSGEQQFRSVIVGNYQNWIYNRWRLHLLKKLHEYQKPISANGFVDSTGYECFINSFHTDDYVSTDFFNQSILFIDSLMNKWEELNNSLTLEIILGETDFGFNIKFHVLRQNETWIDEQSLDKFGEGIMILKS